MFVDFVRLGDLYRGGHLWTTSKPSNKIYLSVYEVHFQTERTVFPELIMVDRFRVSYNQVTVLLPCSLSVMSFDPTGTRVLVPRMTMIRYTLWVSRSDLLYYLIGQQFSCRFYCRISTSRTLLRISISSYIGFNYWYITKI